MSNPLRASSSAGVLSCSAREAWLPGATGAAGATSPRDPSTFFGSLAVGAAVGATSAAFATVRRVAFFATGTDTSGTAAAGGGLGG